MSTVGTALHDCPPVQYELNNYFNTCDPSQRSDVSPLVQALYSNANTNNVQMAVVDGPGKVKIARMRYHQLIPELEVLEIDSCDRDCVADTKRGDLIADYTIDPCVKQVVEGKIQAKDFYYSCQNGGAEITGLIGRMVSALRRKTQTKLVSQISGLNGNWSSTVAETFPGQVVNPGSYFKVKTQKDASIDPYPSTYADIDLAYKMQGFCTTPWTFTGGSLYRYMRLMNAGCCTDSGLDLGSLATQYGTPFIWDRRLQIYMGVEGAMAIQPGALQVIEFNEYLVDPEIAAASHTTIGKNYETMVIYDPLTGMGMNFLFSDNCGVISIIGHTVTKLVTMPLDMFPNGDYMAGSNYITELRVVNV